MWRGLVIWMLLAAPLLAQQKTLTTSVPFQDPAGNVISNGTLYLKLSQDAKITSGGGQVAPKVVTVTLTSGGLVPSGTLIWASDQLTPSNLTYSVTVYDSNGILQFGPENWIIAGASPIDLSQMTPTSIGPYYPPFPQENVANIWTALQTFSGGLAGGPATFTSVNKIVFADQEPGATADVKLNACIAALPGGGVCDARGFGAGAQTIAATVTCGGSTTSAPITLLFDPSTVFTAGSLTVDMLSIGDNCIADGFTVQNYGLGGYTGNAVKFINSSADGAHSVLRNSVLCNGTVITGGPCNGGTKTGYPSGNAILMQTSSTLGNEIVFARVEHVRIVGFNNGVFLDSLGTPGSVYAINGNIFGDVEVTDAANCFNLTSNTGDILGNKFIGDQCQFGPQSVYGIYTSANSSSTQNLYGNEWMSSNDWDYGAGQTAVYWDLYAKNNWFWGVNVPGVSGTEVAGSGAANNNVFSLFDSAFAAQWPTWNINGDFLISSASNGHGLMVKTPDTQWNIQPHVSATGDLGFTLAGIGTILKLSGTAATVEVPTIIDNGSNIIYRCTVAGTLRVGQLTSVSTDCGTAVDTGLRTN